MPRIPTGRLWNRSDEEFAPPGIIAPENALSSLRAGEYYGGFMRETIQTLAERLRLRCKRASVGLTLTLAVAALLTAVPFLPSAEAKTALPAGSLQALAETRVEARAENEPIQVYLYADGVCKTVTLNGGSVSGALKEAGVTLSAADRLDPAAETPLENGMSVSVYRVAKAILHQTEIIPYTQIRNPSQYITKGQESVRQAGADGQKSVSYEVVTENGIEVSRRVLSETVLSEPVDKIVEYGSGGTIVTDDGEVLSYVRKIDVEATAYTTEGARWKRTFSGTVARVGAIAVDPKTIPLGTSVYITSPDGAAWVYGKALCEDTGGAIKGNVIDLFFDTRSECFSFGRRAGVLYILET